MTDYLDYDESELYQGGMPGLYAPCDAAGNPVGQPSSFWPAFSAARDYALRDEPISTTMRAVSFRADKDDRYAGQYGFTVGHVVKAWILPSGETQLTE